MVASRARRGLGATPRVLWFAVVLALSACAGTSPVTPDQPSTGQQAARGGSGPRSSTASSPGSSTASSPASSTAPANTPAVEPMPSAAPGTITFAFGGDVNFDGPLAALVQRPDGLADLRPVLDGADLAVVNLETAITDRGSPEAKIYHFRTTPQALTTLAQAGVDAVSLANNHAVDYGPDGLTDTLAAKARSPIPVMGIGKNADEAFAPATFTVRGVSIAVIASTQVNDLTVHKYPATDSRPGIAGNLDNTRLLAAVRAAVASHDVVVVFLHWGVDYTSCPDSAQTSTAAALEKAGADVVVGGHAHRVQGAGWLGRTYVDYGLGNFVWHNTRGDLDARSGVLTVAVDVARAHAQGAAGASGRATAPSVVTGSTWTPLLIGEDGVPRRQAPPVAKTLRDAWDNARSCARLSGSPGR